MSQPLVSIDPKLAVSLSEVYFDDFYGYLSASTGPWLTFTVNSGTVAASTAQSSGKVSAVTLTTGGTDGNYVGLTTALTNFQFALNTPLFHRSRILMTDQATNTGNVYSGFWSARPSITNGVLTLSGSAAFICKLDGEDNFRVASSVNSVGTQQLTDLAYVNTVPHTYEINVNGRDLAYLYVTYLVDGVQLKDYTTHVPIQHAIPVASSAAMYSGLGIQTGATAVQTAFADFTAFSQIRI